jgi:hypothetical protein
MNDATKTKGKTTALTGARASDVGMERNMVLAPAKNGINVKPTMKVRPI